MNSAETWMDWRCPRCRKLLGQVIEGRLHLKFARGHEYLVGFPATSVCRGCRSLNELTTADALTVLRLPGGAAR